MNLLGTRRIPGRCIFVHINFRLSGSQDCCQTCQDWNEMCESSVVLLASPLPSQAFPFMHTATVSATPSPVAPVQPAPTHPVLIGYVFWIFGFIGAHRFYFGKPLTGVIWFFTGGLFLIGWIVDLFLIPSMAEEANRRYHPGRVDHSVTWCLLLFLGLFGIHRLYMGKIITGILYMFTGGLFGIGYAYDALTLNEQVEEVNAT